MAFSDDFRTQFSVRRVYVGSWAVFALRPIALLGIPIVLIGPLAALETVASLGQAGLDEQDGMGWLIIYSMAVLLGLVATYAAQAAITSLMIDSGPDWRPVVGDVVLTGFRLAFPMLLQSLLVAAAVGAGLALLIVPGVIFATMWSVAAVVLVAENTGPIAAISRSARLTEGLRVPIFLALLPIAVLYLLLSFGLQGFSLEGPEVIAQSNLILGIASNVATRVFPAVLLCAFSVALYRELLAIKGSDAQDDLAAVFT